MSHSSPKPGRDHGRRSPNGGFTLTELLIVVVVLGVVASLIVPALASTRTKVRSSSCLTNLKHLGTAFIMYQNDNLDRVPFAALKTAPGGEMSWDDYLNFYLGGKKTLAEKKAATDVSQEPTPFVLCPGDESTVRLGGTPHHRSYAMPRFIFNPVTATWPPSRETPTGVGLFLDLRDADRDERAANVSSTHRFEHDGETLTAPCRVSWHVRGGLVMDDAHTILLTDRHSQMNLAGGITSAFIDNAADHFENSNPAARAHSQVNHYLMFDGSVAKLAPEQTLGEGRAATLQSGMWTIKPGD